MGIQQQGISTQHKIFWPSEWMAWEKSLEAFAFRRGSIHTPISTRLLCKGEFLKSDLLSFYRFELEFIETGFWKEEKGILLIEMRNQIIGAIRFERQSFLDCLDIHFYIFQPQHRGKGVMTETLSLFASYLFATKK